MSLSFILDTSYPMKDVVFQLSCICTFLGRCFSFFWNFPLLVSSTINLGASTNYVLIRGEGGVKDFEKMTLVQANFLGFWKNRPKSNTQLKLSRRGERRGFWLKYLDKPPSSAESQQEGREQDFKKIIERLSKNGATVRKTVPQPKNDFPT